MTTIARLPIDARNVRTFTTSGGRTLAYMQLQPLADGAVDRMPFLFAKGDIAFDSIKEWPADAAARDPDLAENDAFFGPGYWDLAAPEDGSKPPQTGARLVVLDGLRLAHAADSALPGQDGHVVLSIEAADSKRAAKVAAVAAIKALVPTVERAEPVPSKPLADGAEGTVKR